MAVTGDGAGMPVAYAVPHGLYRYVGGYDWERLGGDTEVPFLQEDDDPTINDLEFIHGKYWVCTRSSGLWTFDETDQNWERVTGIFGNNVVGIGYSGDSIVVATPSSVWLSTDKGITFGPFPNIDLPGGIHIVDVAVHSPGFEIALITDERTLLVRNSVETTFDHPIPNWVGAPTCIEWREVPSSEELVVMIGSAKRTDQGGGVFQALNPHLDTPTWPFFHQWTSGGDAPIFSLHILEDNVRMYAASLGDGIFYNDNQGVGAWNIVNGGLMSQFVFDITGVEESVWAGGSDGLYTSEGTLTWALAPRMPCQNFIDIDIDPDRPEHIYCAPIGSGVAITENAGGSWSRSGVNEITFANCLAVGKDANDLVVYCGDFLNKRLAYSREGGENWVLYQLPQGSGQPVYVATVPDDASMSWWVMARDVGNVDDFDLWRGESFFNTLGLAYNLGTDEVLDLEYSPLDDNLYYVTRNGKTFRIDDPGIPSEPVDAADAGFPPSSHLMQIEASGDGLYGLADNRSVFRSTDGGESWRRVEGVVGVERIAASPAVPGALIAVLPALSEPGYEVAYTPDGGARWFHLEGVIPGILQYCEMAAEDTVAEAYVATEKGVFHRQFFLNTAPVGDTLDITITAETRQFRPEIEEVAEFRLDGEGISTLTYWEFAIETVEGDYIYSEIGSEPPPPTLIWDGYTTDGWMWGEDEYRGIFTGGNDAGEVAVDTTDDVVAVVLGKPPMSTMREATEGHRLLIEDPEDTDFARLIYRSRKPGEMFSVAYDIGTEEFLSGALLSDSPDENTVISSIAAKDTDAYWTCWVDAYEDQDGIKYPTLYAMVETDIEHIWYEIISFEDVKVSQALIGISLDGTPLIAMVSNNAGMSIGDLYLYHPSTDSWGHEAIFHSQMDAPVEDVELVAATDGVHILYLAEGTLHDVVWTEEGVELDTTIDPRIEGVSDFSATSYSGDNINLAYTDGGNLFYLEYSGGAWGTTPEEVPASPPSGYGNLTSNINSAGTFTVAWESASSVYYIQRRQGGWSTQEHQTPAGSAFNPQMAMRTYTTDPPLIAWTDGAGAPYKVNLVQLGEEPIEDDSIAMEIIAPEEVLVGDTLEVSVIVTNTLVDTIEVIVFGEGFEFEARPSYVELYPADSAGFDSLYARFDSTAEFPEGFYRLEAYARGDGMEKLIEHFFEVKEPPEEMLIDEVNVFFVPSPAINQQTGRIYYDLFYEADLYISIFTTRGRRILFYEEQRASPGFGEFIEIDISELGADVYFFVLEADADPDGDDIPYDPDTPAEIDTYRQVTKPFVVVR